MSDSGFREIQLSGKHVVFLFMAGAVAAVAIFLLGVSVGRGVTKPDAAAQATPAPADAAPAGGQSADALTKTTPEQGELKFHDTLQGKAGAKGTPATPAPSASPAAAPAPPAKAVEKPVATASPSPNASAGPGAAAPSGQSAGAVWYVPVAAFRSSANADTQVAQLKAKGITATVHDAGKSVTARYRVRVGPLDRAAADAMVARLRKEGLTPSQPIR